MPRRRTTAEPTTPVATPPPGGATVPLDGPRFETGGSIMMEGKAVGTILMLAAESDGISFIVLNGDFDFHVPTTHPNYAAMVSLLLAAQAAGDPVAVKYPAMDPRATSERRQATAVARGIHAVISGASF